MTDHSERNAILSRVREALKVKTDSHVRQKSSVVSHGLPVIQSVNKADLEADEFMPPVGSDIDSRIAIFSEISNRLQTDFRVVDSLNSAAKIVKELATENEWKRVGYHENELVRQVVDSLDIKKLSTGHTYEAKQLEECDAGISGCDALIAQTASVLVTAQSAGGRALSVLPHHHVVIAESNQMLGSMVDGYRLLKSKFADEHWPSFISFITGPSRTADVERVLVLGAHGPKKLTVIMVRED